MLLWIVIGVIATGYIGASIMAGEFSRDGFGRNDELTLPEKVVLGFWIFSGPLAIIVAFMSLSASNVSEVRPRWNWPWYRYLPAHSGSSIPYE